MRFVHLGVMTEYSITESIVRIKDVVKRAVKAQIPALGMTDLSNLHATIKFYNTCLKSGVKPIIGSQLRLNNTQYRVNVLAMNEQGLKNLTELVSRGYLMGQHQDIPVVKSEWIFEQHDGLIILMGVNSDIGEMLVSANPAKAEPYLQQWIDCFGQRFYFALSRTHRPYEDDFICQAVKYAEHYQVGVVAYNDIHFLDKDDFDAHEARVCIADGYTLNDERRPRKYSPEQYFKSHEQMCELFADIPSAIENTFYIAQRCNVQLKLGTYFLPEYPIPEGFTMETFFHHLAKEGLEQRLDTLYPPENRNEDWQDVRKPYDERLEYEVSVILQMGFPGYFLIVMDFIQWAKNNDIPVGPGRGSGAGSLVAYSLKITDLDPLRYELLFERFLNPERVSMPDFDVDFCIDGRDKVINYVAETYGREAVSQIATFGTMAAKGVIKDVARVLGKSYGLADKLSKLIPTKPTEEFKEINLDNAVKMVPELKDILENPSNADYDDCNDIWKMALKLEGITRNTGKHAGGVVIAPGKITDFSAILCDADGTNRVSQYDKDDVESAGLVKFDFLGLRNLTVIKEALQTINQEKLAQGESLLDLDKIPLDDLATYRLLQDAKSTAVFQLESTGMKKYLAKLAPTNIDDIIAMCALYRPGPLDAGMVDMFIERKHGREKVVYDHPDLEGILNSTYGVIVYQEQVMQISQVLAGYTLGGADMLRRAMGKKKPEEMAKQRESFVAGASKRDISETVSGGIFDLMEKFAGYGFNKSHSAAYGLVAYQTAWLKTHYPSQFMSAVLSSEMQNTDNVVFLIEDCRSIGLDVTPPSINRSMYRFTADGKKTIIYGLGAIKGVGENAMQSVIEARHRDGEFKDLFDFCHRVDMKKINKRTMEALIRAGALDCLGFERSELMEYLPEAIQAAEQARQNRISGMMDLFGEVEEVQRKPLQPIKAWSDEVRLKGEKETLGLYLTGHPINIYKNELKHFIHHKLNQLTVTAKGQPRFFAGLIIDVATFPNRVVIRLDDGTARLDVNCSNERFQRYKHILKVEHVAVIEGDLYEREGDEILFGRLNRAFSVYDIRQRRASSVHLHLNQQHLEQPQLIDELKHALTPFCQVPNVKLLPVYLHVQQPYASASIVLEDAWQVHASDELLSHLRTTFGKTAVEIQYQVKSKALEQN